MNTIVKNIIKKIEINKKDSRFEVLHLDNKLIIFANKGSIHDIKEELNKQLKKKLRHTLKIVNIATAYVVPLNKHTTLS